MSNRKQRVISNGSLVTSNWDGMWMWKWMWASPESIGQMQSGTGMLNARAHSYTVRSYYASGPIPRDRQPDTHSINVSTGDPRSCGQGGK